MRFLSALEQAKWHILTLWGIIVLLVVINVVCAMGWMHSQSHIRIDIPPRIPESGLSVTQGHVPKATVYSFAYYIWQNLNHWSKNGMTDYKTNIQQFTPFVTPGFKRELIDNYNTLLNAGELQDRLRTLQGTAGMLYSPEAVRYLGHGTWYVRLQLRLTEYMNMNAKVVKDIQMQYTLRVVRFDVSAKQNPWGLALAGFAQSPVRVKTIT